MKSDTGEKPTILKRMNQMQDMTMAATGIVCEIINDVFRVEAVPEKEIKTPTCIDEAVDSMIIRMEELTYYLKELRRRL